MTEQLPYRDLIEIRALPESIGIPAGKAMLQDEYRTQLFSVAKDLCGYKHITHRTHGKIIEALEAPTKRKLICVPRGTFKSSLGVVAYSIQNIIKNPNIRIMIDSELYSNSRNFVREIKSHLERKAFTDIFGSLKSESDWREGSFTVNNRTKVLKESTVIASGVGSTKVGQHVDLIIMDDINSDKNSQTKEGRDKVINHYRMNLSILEPEGTIVVIGTRYSMDDLIGFIKDNEIDEPKQYGLLTIS